MPTPQPLDVKLMQAMAKLLLGCFVAMLCAGVMWLLIKNSAFTLRDINVYGDVQHTNAVTIRANVTPQLMGNFFTIDLNQARRVFESVPWVRRAVVQRQFPNQLLVELEEHQAVAYWGSAADSRLLNSAGEVFVANTGDLDNEVMPRLQGPDTESALVLEMYKILAPDFEALKLPLKGLELSARGSWRATLDTGAEIELGRGDASQIQLKVKRFVITLKHVLAQLGRRINSLESADLRHENGYALRVRGLGTMQPLAHK